MNIIKLAILGLLAFATAGCANNQDKYLTYVQTGDKVPVTQFTDTQGSKIDLAESSNNKLLILFATWCHDSQRTMALLANSNLHLSPNIDIIGIGREESPAALNQFAAEYELNFAMVADPNREIYRQFANSGIPRLILLDADNRVVKTIIGEQDNPIKEVVW